MCYGISCWPWGDREACKRTIEDRPNEGRESFMARAGREGWRIGHWDGQAYYVCPEHRDGVWDAVPLYGASWRVTFAERIVRARFARRQGHSRFGVRMIQFAHTTRFRFLDAPHRASWAQKRQRARDEANA